MLIARTKTAPNVTIESTEERGVCNVISPFGQFTLTNITGHALAVFRRLSEQGLDDQSLQSELANGTPVERLRLQAQFETLVRHGLLRHTLFDDDQPVVSRVVISKYFQEIEFETRALYRLSRFAICRGDFDGLLIESPRCFAQVILHESRGTALLASVTGQSIVASDMADEIQLAIVKFLAEAGLLVACAVDGMTDEDRDGVLRQWEFHDLLFHSRSRPGRHNNPVGGTYRFRGEIEPQPSIKSPMSDQVVSLYKPNIAELKATDKTFTEVLENRRSLRTDRATPLTLRELGAFLYRSARVQRQEESSGLTWRSTPSGGSLHELEVYVVADHCDGLEPGLYHYSPLEHQLERLAIEAEKLAPLSDQAAWAQRVDHRAAVQILVTARFQRVSWKYSSIAYALILKNVGAFFQTMYLVATAMGLAPCAIGTGNSEIFSRITGIPFEVEGTVGEFTLR